MKKYRSLIIAAALAAGASLHAESPVTKWLDGKYATGDWFGARTSLEDKGIILGGSWKANYFGVVDGGIGRRGLSTNRSCSLPSWTWKRCSGSPVSP